MQFKVKGINWENKTNSYIDLLLTEGNILKIGIIIKPQSGTTLGDGRILATPTEAAFEDVSPVSSI